MAQRFPSPPSVPLLNHLTGRPYRLEPASNLTEAPTTLASLVAICNEPDVYEWLFHRRLEGRSYTEAQARQFMQWSAEGWATDAYFVFVVLDETGRIAAACDIKSSDPTAEIGYWASQHHRGIMTNAVKALSGWAAAAGFKQLFARVRDGNDRSRRVLTRAGFIQGGEAPAGYKRFEFSFG